MRNNNNNQRVENKVNVGNNEINKNKGGKKLVDFIHIYIKKKKKTLQFNLTKLIIFILKIV